MTDVMMSGKEVVKVLGIEEGKVLEEIEKVMSDDHFGEGIADRFISYKSVLQNNRCSPMQYVKAVEYVSHRVSGKTIVQSYEETYPERLMRDGVRKPVGTIKSLAQFYDKGALIQDILTQVQIPLHVMMMNERVSAAGVLADLMINGESERIQMESADRLLNHIQAPEVVKMELDIGIKGDETLDDIGKSLDKLAQLAQAKIQGGTLTPLEVIES